MKKFILIFLLLIVVIGGALVYTKGKDWVIRYLPGIFSPSSVKPLQQQTPDVLFVYDNIKSYTIAIFTKPLEIAYIPQNARSVKLEADNLGWQLAVNGSYFRGSYIDAEHAGFLQIYGTKYFGQVAVDPQITHIVIYDKVRDSLNFVPADEFDPKVYVNENYLIFQTGPLVIKDNIVQTELIDDSSNGSTRFLRTLLGYTNTDEKFFVITEANYTLSEVAEELLNLDAFKGEIINVVNLDGGSSTAMYSSQLSQYDYAIESRLPLLLGIK